MTIDYNHSANLHTLEGPRTAFPFLFDQALPSSILDLGCGVGAWLRAAMDCGVTDVIGVDGVEIPGNQLLFPADRFVCRDLSAPIDLGRRFGCAVCLEVAEHLDAAAAEVIVQSLTVHTDVVFFSAACPGQSGQHHVNCQWPAYWQKLFNDRGYACNDAIRWRIWAEARIEPWYRQNMFMAQKDTTLAGRESRIKAVLHPDLHLPSVQTVENSFENHLLQIEHGRMPASWYLKTPAQAIAQKFKRRLG